MNLSKDLEFWMTNLPDGLKSIPVVNLAIPGSHDSTSYAINGSSHISPDARNPIQYLKFLEPILRPVMIKWSKTQNVDVKEQLRAGIRYFDLRIAMEHESGQFYFVHNLYAARVNGILEEINGFLNEHSSEIVILDFQHFYDLTKEEHQQLVSLLLSIFGTKLHPNRPSMSNITLNSMKENGYQVIMIYRWEDISEDFLWPSKSFPTPWPDTVDIPQLISFLTDELETRNCCLGFVSQCVLTPTVWYVCMHLFGSLKSTCVLPLEQEKCDWLWRQKPGKNGLNVVISDFIDYQDYKFSKEVINLNKKLLENIPKP